MLAVVGSALPHALDRRTKELILILLDALAGQATGARNHAAAAMRLGLTLPELAEGLAQVMMWGRHDLEPDGCGCDATLHPHREARPRCFLTLEPRRLAMAGCRTNRGTGKSFTSSSSDAARGQTSELLRRRRARAAPPKCPAGCSMRAGRTPPNG